MSNLPYQFRLLLGDTSGDGHGMSETYIVNSSHSASQIEESHKKLIKKGINLKKECGDYQDSEISRKFYDKVKNLGVDLLDFIDDDQDLWVDHIQFATIYLELAKINIPDLEYEFHDMDYIEIGGYGLFTS